MPVCAYAEIYEAAIELHRASSELSIFCREVGRPVQIA